MGTLAISFVFRVGFCRRSKITGRRPSNRFHEIVLREIRQTSGKTEPRPIPSFFFYRELVSRFTDRGQFDLTDRSIDPVQRPPIPFAFKRTSAKARS